MTWVILGSDGSYFELDGDTQLVEVPDDADFDEIGRDHPFTWWPLQEVVAQANLLREDS